MRATVTIATIEKRWWGSGPTLHGRAYGPVNAIAAHRCRVFVQCQHLNR
jgi:hypothetical protein